MVSPWKAAEVPAKAVRAALRPAGPRAAVALAQVRSAGAAERHRDIGAADSYPRPAEIHSFTHGQSPAGAAAFPICLSSLRVRATFTGQDADERLHMGHDRSCALALRRAR